MRQWSEQQAMRALVLEGLDAAARVPPAGVRAAARAALEGDTLTPAGRARCRQLASGRPVGPGTMRQIAAHRLGLRCWGGESAAAWAAAELGITALVAAGWDEAKHPRDPDGRFRRSWAGNLGDAIKSAKDSGSSVYITRNERGETHVHVEKPDDAPPGTYRVSPAGSLLKVGAKGGEKPVPAKGKDAIERFLGGREPSRADSKTGGEGPAVDDTGLPASQRAQVDRGRAAIAKVHKTDGMPTIRLESAQHAYSSNAGGGTPDGYYRPQQAGGSGYGGGPGDQIGVNPESKSKGNTFVHEYGHALDYMLLGDDLGAGISLSDAPPRNRVGAAMTQFVGAARRSPTMAKVRANSPTATTRDYMSEPREMWARAYAQFIAEKSGDTTLAAEVQQYADRSAHDGGVPMVWGDPRNPDDDDWPPVRDAVQRVLEAKGLM